MIRRVGTTSMFIRRLTCIPQLTSATLLPSSKMSRWDATTFLSEFRPSTQVILSFDEQIGEGTTIGSSCVGEASNPFQSRTKPRKTSPTFFFSESTVLANVPVQNYVEGFMQLNFTTRLCQS
jgi:hypothetical protein